MTTLHIKALSGPRPVTASAVRTLLADGRLAARSQVLSLDRGQTWLPVEDALAVVERLSVADADVDAAMAGGRSLHPIAMPLGAVAITLLVAGIGLGGGPAAPVIAAAPVVAVEVAGAVAAAGVAGVGSVAGSAVQLATQSWSSCLTAGCMPADLQAAMAAAATAAAVPETTGSAAAVPPAGAPAGDLQAAWATLIADQTADADAWKLRAGELAAQTTASGIDGWTVSISQVEPYKDAMRKTFPKAGKALRFAEMVAAQDATGGSVLLMCVVEDQALAESLDAAAKDGRQVRIGASIDKVQDEASNRTVILTAYVRSLQ